MFVFFNAVSTTFQLFNPFPNKPWFSRVCSTSPLKTMWKKEILLVTSNFSFSHIVFYPFGELSAIFVKFKIVVCKLFHFGRVQRLSFGKGLTISQTNPGFNTFAVQVFRKHCGKRKNCSLRAISSFPTVFSTCFENFLEFSSNLKLSSANALSLEFVVWKRVYGDSSQILFPGLFLTFTHPDTGGPVVVLLVLAPRGKAIGTSFKDWSIAARGSNPRLPTHKADALTTRPPLRSYADLHTLHVMKIYFLSLSQVNLLFHDQTRLPAHKADALTTRPPRRSYADLHTLHVMKIYFLSLCRVNLLFHDQTRLPAHKADALTTRPQRRSFADLHTLHVMKIYF